MTLIGFYVSYMPRYVNNYHIADFFKGKNYHKSIAICENFTLEI